MFINSYEDGATRGNAKLLTFVKILNFILLFGSTPGMAVKGKTTMVKDVMEAIEFNLDRLTFEVTIPEAFDSLYGQDVSFEMVQSSSI